MFPVVVVLFFWSKGSHIDVSGRRRFVFFGGKDATSMFLVVVVSRFCGSVVFAVPRGSWGGGGVG